MMVLSQISVDQLLSFIKERTEFFSFLKILSPPSTIPMTLFNMLDGVRLHLYKRWRKHCEILY